MKIEEELRINGHQPCVGVETETGKFFCALIAYLDRINPNTNLYYLLSQAYTYGVIQGKREERARRKQQRESQVNIKTLGDSH